MKKLIVALSFAGLLTAPSVHAGGYSPMPSIQCIRTSGCMEAFAAEEAADRKAERMANLPPVVTKPKVVEPKKAEPKRCVEKPGGWSELEFYERNTWFFQTWGRLMTVEEKDAFRCGWPV